MNNFTWNVMFLLLLSISNLTALWFDSTTTKLAATIIPIILFFGLKRVLNYSDKVLILLFIPLFILSFADLVYLLQFNVQITAGMISAIFESDIREGFEFAREAPVFLIFTSIAYIMCWVVLFITSNRSEKAKKGNFLLTAVFIVLPFADMLGKGASARSFPLGAMKAAYIYSRDTINANKLLEERKGFRFNATLSKNVPEKTNIVMVIGETSRRDYFSLYGFSRKTSPQLEQVKPLAIFSDAISPANATIPSLMSMLSMATVTDSRLFYTSKSIVSLAKEAGYMTYWLSSQARFGEFDATSGATGIEANKKVFINQTRAVSLVYDNELLPHLDQLLDDGSKRKFVVMHLYGSHLAYDRRYPKEFNQFKDIPPNYENHSSEIQRKINAYTNSILYTDHILSEIIKRLEAQSKPSCMVYTSDHGEYLASSPDEVFTGHGYPKPHKVEVEVPLIVWCNKEFREIEPKKWHDILSNQTKKINNEDVFYSLADLLQVEFNHMKKERSFFGDSYQPILPRKVRSASDKKVFDYNEL